jgi:glycerophosphoryl diester phosphodiesterase
MKRNIILTCLFIAHLGAGLHAQTKVIAHRGFWNTENSAQNSLVALYKAHEAGVYGSEFDVIITADGIPVINHDDSISGFAIEQTRYDLLRDLKLKNGEVLPTLEQYLVHGKACRGTQLILEIKPHSTKESEDRAVSNTVSLVNKYKLQSQVEYISFSLDICKELVRLQPNAQVSYLNGDLSPQELKSLGITGLDYHYNVFEKHPEWIDEAQSLGLTLNVWTVNNPEMMGRLIKQKVNYLTTDNPLLAKELIGE